MHSSGSRLGISSKRRINKQRGRVQILSFFNLWVEPQPSLIQQARNIAIPTKRINTYYRRTLPPNIIQTIKMKRQAHRTYMRTHTDVDRRIYRQLQDDVKLMIRNYEKENFTKLTLKIDEKHVTNIQEFWIKIKQIKGNFTQIPL